MAKTTIETSGLTSTRTLKNGKKIFNVFAIILNEYSYLIAPRKYEVTADKNGKILVKKSFKNRAEAKKHFEIVRARILKML